MQGIISSFKDNNTFYKEMMYSYSASSDVEKPIRDQLFHLDLCGKQDSTGSFQRRKACYLSLASVVISLSINT